MHMDSLYVPMFVHHVCAWCPRRSAEGVRSCVTRATASCELLCSSKKQAWVLWKNKLSSLSLCSLSSLVLVFLIESQGVQFLSHRREGCRLSLDCLELHDLELWLVERYAMYVRQMSIAITRYL